MPPLDDAEIARRLLHHLARAFGAADAQYQYAASPARIQGGFDTTIFGFTLDHVPSVLQGPLILRLSNADADPARVKLETVVQNTLADMGFPAPRVMVSESDPTIIGGPFMVMARVPGRTLAHDLEGFGAGSSLPKQMKLLVNLPAILTGIIDQWLEMQIRLHQLPAEPLLQAVTAAGLDASIITFGGQLARLRAIAQRHALAGVEPVLVWLEQNRSASTQGVTICHGDFHPLNIMADNGKPTGVIDWANAVIAEPAMDVGSAIANISTVPINLPWPLRLVAQTMIGAALQRYERAYRARQPLDGEAVRYYQVYRAVAQLIPVAAARARGHAGRGAFHSAAGIDNLIGLIRRLSGVSVRF